MKTRKKILYVDDDEHTLNIVAKHLMSHGYEVHSSSSPFVAQILSREKPDLLILDIKMPLLSGDKLASILSKQGYMSDIPILFFSGEPAEKIEMISSRFQGSTYVTKQSGLDNLSKTIRTLIP